VIHEENFVAVRIRLKKMGRKHKPFFRVCATDARAARDGRVIEELGYYDPMVRDTDARAILNGERIDYWMGVGAQPSDKVAVLIKKYGTNGTHLEQQKAALEQISNRKQQAAVAAANAQRALAEKLKADEEAAAAKKAEEEAAAKAAAEAAAAEAEAKAAEGAGEAEAAPAEAEAPEAESTEAESTEAAAETEETTEG
jgi:small subunit ribosomal protein S16